MKENTLQETIIRRKSSFRADPDELTFKESFLSFITLFIPVVIFLLCQFLAHCLNISFLGKVYNNTSMIDGIGLVESQINLSVIPVIYGMNTVLMIILSNSFGSKNFTLFSKVIQLTRIFLILFCLVMSILNYVFAYLVYPLIKIDHEVYGYSLRYLTVIGIYMIIFSINSINFTYLNVLNRPFQNVLIQILSLSFHPVWCSVYITWMNLDVMGAGFALISTNIFSCILMNSNIYFYNPYPEIKFFSKMTLTGMAELINFSLPYFFIIFIEYCGIEVLSFIASSLDKKYFDTYMIFTYISTIYNCFVQAFEVITSIIFNTALTSESPMKTKKNVSHLFLYFTIIIIILAVVMFLISRQLIEFYISDLDVISIGLKYYFCIPIYLSLNSIACSLTQILLSCNFAITVSVFYLIGAILVCFSSYLFANTLKMQIFGIFLCLIIEMVVFIAFFSYYIFNLNYELEKVEALKRVEEESEFNIKDEDEIKKLK